MAMADGYWPGLVHAVGLEPVVAEGCEISIPAVHLAA
jgi:hypothetical protein